MKILFLDVKVEERSNGPAVTLNISNPRSHDISVDISPSLQTDRITLQRFRWKRPLTSTVLTKDVVDEIEGVKLHVVPKGNTLWTVSVSRAERVLMSRIDHDKGCRKMCHKLLKFDVRLWIREHKLKGISTILLKVLFF